jgi:transposase
LTLDSQSVEATLQEVKALLARETSLSPALRAALNALLALVAALLQRLNLNSRNSSKPPSTDPNRPKTAKPKGSRNPGGQNGHVGATLQPVEEPDIIERLTVDRSTLPEGDYRPVGFEKRQVFDLDIALIVTEYRAEILADAQGNRFTAPFPAGVSSRVQYGPVIKAHAVYLSQQQLLPYHRVADYFREQLQIPVSAGSLFNFNQEAFERLAAFEPWVCDQLAQSEVVHSDETSINVNGQRQWLHCASNAHYTAFFAHLKRGTEALDAIGILPRFQGLLCHDHWKPYFRYGCLHSLCNAHHLRELEWAFEQDGQDWAKAMQDLLIECNQEVHQAGGCLSAEQAETFRARYRTLLQQADSQCPPPDPDHSPPRRGRQKRSKSRNLLERLRDFENETLRFLTDPRAPFTNNQGENDIRMTKVHQKISGCFRSPEGAQMFCRIRSYLSTCRKHGISSTRALSSLFQPQALNFADFFAPQPTTTAGAAE